jgi:hypothetical protein
MSPTPEEIRRRGVDALIRELGAAGFIRFVQQFEAGKGDYGRERHKWVDQTSLEEILLRASELRSRENGRREGPKRDEQTLG